MLNRRQRASLGVTLIELIVVIAIILMTAAIVVPAFVRSSALSRSDLQVAAYDLTVVLQAARQYSVTHRVDTAVVYGVNNAVDSVTAAETPVMDQFAIVRRLTPDEFNAINVAIPEAEKMMVLGSETDRDYPFVPLQSGKGLRALERGTCVLGRTLNFEGTELFPGLQYVQVSGGRAVAGGAEQALLPIRVYSPWPGDSNLVKPRHDSLAYYPSGDVPANREDDANFLNHRFPAHVFSSDGPMRHGSALQRTSMYVAPSPEAPVTERFATPDNPAEPGVIFRQISLYTSTGRVKIGS